MATARGLVSVFESFHQEMVELLDVDSLLPILIKEEMLFSSEVDQLMSSHRTKKAKAVLLCSILSQKGPRSFNQFISALREDGREQHIELARNMARAQNRINAVTPVRGDCKRRCLRWKIRKNDQQTSKTITLDNFLISSEIKILGTKELGRGAFGTVYAVKYEGSLCAAKEIHRLLISEEIHSLCGAKEVHESFLKECECLANLKHPNIVQFYGIYHPAQHSLPLMVVEMMDCSLENYVQRHSHISVNAKFSMLLDVVLGLQYLHDQIPQIIHCDLNPENILLRNTALPIAKISGLGIARTIKAHSKTPKSQGVPGVPGIAIFLPPEALLSDPQYSASSDIFSYGGVALYVSTQTWPVPLSKDKVINEVERRQKYLDMMSGEIEVLKPLVEACLNNDPKCRPSVSVLLQDIGQLMTSSTISKQIREGREKNIDALLDEAEQFVDHLDEETKQKVNPLLAVTENDFSGDSSISTEQRKQGKRTIASREKVLPERVYLDGDEDHVLPEPKKCRKASEQKFISEKSTSMECTDPPTVSMLHQCVVIKSGLGWKDLGNEEDINPVGLDVIHDDYPNQCRVVISNEKFEKIPLPSSRIYLQPVPKGINSLLITPRSQWEEYICPDCDELMDDCVLTSCGHQRRSIVFDDLQSPLRDDNDNDDDDDDRDDDHNDNDNDDHNDDGDNDHNDDDGDDHNGDGDDDDQEISLADYNSSLLSTSCSTADEDHSLSARERCIESNVMFEYLLEEIQNILNDHLHSLTKLKQVSTELKPGNKYMHTMYFPFDPLHKLAKLAIPGWGSISIDDNLILAHILANNYSLEYSKLRKYCINQKKLCHLYKHGPEGLVIFSASGQKAVGTVVQTYYGYRDKEIIGSGGFGNVYKCSDQVAVKEEFIINPLVYSTKLFQQIMKLDHPNVIKVTEYVIGSLNKDGNKCFLFVMPFKNQRDLRRQFIGGNLACVLDYMKENPYQEKYIFRNYLVLFKCVFKGLNYLKNQGMVHRDIESSNILVHQNCACSSPLQCMCADDGDVVYMLGDLDLVCFEEENAHLTTCDKWIRMVEHEPVGTTGMQAPELFFVTDEGKHMTTHKSDVWSGLVTMMHVLIGKKTAQKIRLQASDFLEATKPKTFNDPSIFLECLNGFFKEEMKDQSNSGLVYNAKWELLVDFEKLICNGGEILSQSDAHRKKSYTKESPLAGILATLYMANVLCYKCFTKLPHICKTQLWTVMQEVQDTIVSGIKLDPSQREDAATIIDRLKAIPPVVCGISCA